jgi:hypothetical protein
MSVSVTYTIEVGDADPAGTRYDVTDRVRGYNAAVTAPIGKFGRSNANIQLQNHDGALTPGAGGTFGAVDWFKQGVFVYADIVGPTSTVTVDVFHGIVVDFDLIDDGVTSEVLLSCVDVLTVGGQSVSEFESPAGSGISTGAANWIRFAFNGYPSGSVTLSGVDLPLLGESDSEANVENLTISPTSLQNTIGLSELSLSQPVLDWLNNTILPSGPNVAWPTTVTFASSKAQANVSAFNSHLVRSDTTRNDLAFAENASAGELPFRNLDRGFTTDQMINQAVVTNLDNTLAPAGTTTVRNEASIADYGTRSIQTAAVMVGYDTSSRVNYNTRQLIAERYANVRADVEFVVRSFTVTDLMVNQVVGSSQTSAESFAQLLDVADCPWQIVSVEYTPAGAVSSTTEHAVIVGRYVSGTPGETSVRLDLLPFTYVSAFVLDDSLLGVLDTDRLG